MRNKCSLDEQREYGDNRKPAQSTRNNITQRAFVCGQIISLTRMTTTSMIGGSDIIPSSLIGRRPLQVVPLEWKIPKLKESLISQQALATLLKSKTTLVNKHMRLQLGRTLRSPLGETSIHCSCFLKLHCVSDVPDKKSHIWVESILS